MNGYQLLVQRLPPVTWVASGNALTTLRDLITEYQGRPTHNIGFGFEVTATPTLTTDATVVGLNSLVSRLEFNDGRSVRFRGSFNDLRFFERLEGGGNSGPEAIPGGSTHGIYYQRTLWHAPPHMAGFPGDFGIPCASMLSGNLSWSFGALTDYSADTTAMTSTIYPVAYHLVRDEILVPSFYERSVQTLASKDSNLPLPGLIANLSLANSSAFDAFAAADLADVTIETGLGNVLSGVNASVLTRVYNSTWNRGHLDSLSGDPRNATYDVAGRIVNLASPTAIAAQALNQNPLLWTGPRQKLSKLIARVPSSFRLTWTGTNGSGTIAHLGRFIPQEPPAIATIADSAAKELKRALDPSSMRIKTLSKQPYSGPLGAFFPHVVKFK